MGQAGIHPAVDTGLRRYGKKEKRVGGRGRSINHNYINVLKINLAKFPQFFPHGKSPAAMWLGSGFG